MGVIVVVELNAGCPEIVWEDGCDRFVNWGRRFCGSEPIFRPIFCILKKIIVYA